MKKLILLLFLGGFVFTACQKDDLSSVTELDAVNGQGNSGQGGNNEFDCETYEWPECEPISVAELYAGQNTYVGTVEVTEGVGDEAGMLVVTYKMIEGYCLTETHLEIVGDQCEFPLKGNGNPAQGQFTYGDDPLDCEPTARYVVPMGQYIAAHAVVNCVSEGSGEVTLPSSGTFTTLGKDNGDGTFDNAYPGSLGGYFDLAVTGGILEGTWPAWCADVRKSLGPGEGPFDVHIYSSYDDFPYVPSGNNIGIDKDNIDLVNWLINNQQMFYDMGYNFGEIQNAIWKLLNGIFCQGCTGLGDPATLATRAQEIIDKIPAEAEGYIPGCDEFLLVILLPKDATQPLFIPFPISCDTEECEETAYARNSFDVGCEFPGGNWFTYFKYGMPN